MSRPLVKVCGVTRVEDVSHLRACGVDWAGIILADDAPRQLADADCRVLREAIRAAGLLSVAALGTTTPEEVRSLRQCGFDLVQFEATAPLLAAVSDLDGLLPYFMDGPALLEHMAPWREAALRYPSHFGAASLTGVLEVESAAGGASGQPAHWPRAAAAARLGPTMLAGGLRADNVAEAIRIVRPAGLDLCSGVESAPGLKDRLKLEGFHRAVNSAVGRD